MLNMSRPSSRWLRLAVLLLTFATVFSQSTDSTPASDEELVVCRNCGNTFTGDSSSLNCVDELGEKLPSRINALVFEMEKFEFQRTLIIRRNLTITSRLRNSTKAQLSCSGTNQIFNIERRSRSQKEITVQLRNVKITNCAAPGPDGIVHVGSGVHVVFSNVELVNNGAEGVNHSIIVVDSNAKLEVRGNSSFSNNQGRVMLVGDGSEVIIENGNFSRNTADTNGTVLATIPGGGIHINITGSLFERNLANENNGGVMWLESSSIFLKNGVRFISNVAGHHGGALFLTESRKLHVSDTVFEQNSCHFGKGGAVFIVPLNNSDTRIGRSVFARNSANGVMGMGGAISFGNTDIDSTRQLELASDVLFLKNTARMSGGAVIVYETKTLVHALSAFVSNSAQGAAGGLHVFSSETDFMDDGYIKTTVDDASFISNRGPTRGGGAVFLFGIVRMEMLNSTCRNNSGVNGGAVYAHNAREVILNKGCLFEGNSATEKGGSLYMDRSKVEITDCDFIGNEGGRGGSISVKDGNTFHVRSCTFKGNSASSGGGAIDIENLETLRGHDTRTKLQHVRFLDNMSRPRTRSHEGFGGAMRLTGAGVDANVEHCLFENNTAYWGGSLYLAEAFSTSFIDTNFFRNAADLGGALYIVPLERELVSQYDSTTFIRCRLRKNTADRGGSIYARPDRLNPGVISEVSKSLLSVEDSNFSQNKANDIGGGLFLALMNVSFTGCSFHNNSAIRRHRESTNSSRVLSRSSAGGAVYASAGSSLSVSSTSFTTNNASGIGGAVCIDDAFFNCTRNCTFQMNRSLKGGGIFCSLSSQKYESHQSATLHCHDCVFKRNSALKGGGLYALIPRINPDAQRCQACQRFNGSDRNSTRASLVADGCQSLIFLDPQKMQDNNASVSGHDIFSTQPDAIVVAADNGPMNLVRYVNMQTNEGSSAYKFASPAHKVNINASSLKNMNRGNTSEEMSQLDVKVVDHFGQTIEYSRIFVELKACQDDQNCCGDSGKTDKSFSFDGEEKRVIDHGKVNFANLSISNGLNGSNEQHLWVCFEDESEEQAEIEPMFIDVSFRECYTMEENVTTAGGCRECPQQEYYDNKTNSCKTCPLQATCRGLTIIPKGGFWHATSISHRIYDCHPREACIEDDGERAEAVTKAHKERDLLTWTDPRYNQCNTGYEGILCGSCTENHGRWNDICTECLAIPLMWISVFVSVGWNLLVLLVFIYSARNIVERVHYNQQATSQHQGTSGPSPPRVRQAQQIQMLPLVTDRLLRNGASQLSVPQSTESRPVTSETRNSALSSRNILRWRPIQETLPAEPLPLTNPLSEALKIVFNFIQVIYLAALLSEDLPSVFRWSVIPFDALNLTEPVFLIADCLLKGNEDRAVIRMTLQALFPVFLIFLVCLVPALLKLFRKRTKLGLQDVKLAVLCTVYLYFGPEIRTLLKFLDGVRVEDEYADLGATRFWSIDTSVKFLQGTHAFVFAFIVLPLLLALVVGFPSSLFVSLNKNKDRMQDEDVVSSYGFLYKGYEARYYYWEIVIVIRKTVIAVLSVFAQNAELQSVFISLILVLFLSLQLIVSPFSSDFPGLNALESLSLAVSTLLFFGVSSMLRSHELDKKGLLYAVAWITILVLFFTVLAMGLGLFAAMQDFLNDKLIEKGLYPDKQSVELIPITTKMFKLVGFYFGRFHCCREVRANQQHSASEANEV